MKSDTNTSYSAIESKTICLKAVSPVTIHGGLRKGKETKPELRLSTVNGMMRYWYDALNNRSDKRKSSSDDIFGVVSKDESRKSLIWLTDNQYKKSHEPTRFRPSYSKKFTIEALKTGTKWPITISTKKSDSDIDMLVEGEKALESAVIFGGFGQRGRHGASSFIIPELELRDANDLLSYMQSLTDFYGLKTEKSLKPMLLKNKEPDRQKICWLSSYILDTLLIDINKILSIIRTVTHEINDKNIGLQNILGSSNPKFPSPLHSSIYQYKDGSYSVIVTETSQNQDIKNKYNRAKKLYINKLQTYLKESEKSG